jgi:hypothetical protein
VALSFGLHQLGVAQRPALWSPDFPLFPKKSGHLEYFDPIISLQGRKDVQKRNSSSGEKRGAAFERLLCFLITDSVSSNDLLDLHKPAES